MYAYHRNKKAPGLNHPGAIASNYAARATSGASQLTFFHPDYTVGPGISPGLLASTGRRSRARPR